MTDNDLSALLVSQGLQVSAPVCRKLARYWSLLSQWADAVDLTGIQSAADFVGTLVAGAVAPVQLGLTPPGQGRIVDVGTGSGNPGIPLALYWPHREFVLLEAHTRKAAFLQHAVRELSLSNVTVLHGRAEEVGQDPALRESFSLAITRSAGPAPTAAELCLPLVSPPGEAWLYVAERDAVTLAEQGTALEPLGVTRISLAGDSEAAPARWIARLIKERGSSPVYPRPWPQIKRRPLFPI